VAIDPNPIKTQWDPRAWPSSGPAGPQAGEVLGMPVKPVTGVMRNFYFTSEVHHVFRYAGGETITFQGNDDAWIFVNGHLILDLGGTHEIMRGNVVLSAISSAIWNLGVLDQVKNQVSQLPGTTSAGTVSGLGLEIGKLYDLAIFHANRQPRVSDYQLSLSGFSHTRSVCEPLSP
jgi:fibro-slime domain-containing protein